MVQPAQKPARAQLRPLSEVAYSVQATYWSGGRQGMGEADILLLPCLIGPNITPLKKWRVTMLKHINRLLTLNLHETVKFCNNFALSYV